MQSYGVFGVVQGVPGHEEKIILIRDKDKPWKWKLPGGSSESEYPQDALERELWEEIGIKVMPNPREILRIPKGPYALVFYTAGYYTGELAPGEEVEEVFSFFPEEVRDLMRDEMVFYHHAQALTAYLNSL